MYLLSRSTLKLYILSKSTLKLLSTRVLPLTRRKTGRASHLHHLLLTPFPSFPSISFFRIIMTFSAEFRCYIGSQTLASWPTVLAGLLPSWPMALGPDAVARGARPLTSWRMAPSLAHAKGPLLAAPTAVGHGVMSLTPWATTADVYFCKICDGPYIFAKSR
jgi:hypothetical protein